MTLQSAAIPYRYGDTGEVEILLVTSRKKRRWILPKGNVRHGMVPHSSAAKEAFEEGGVIGRPDVDPIASYQIRQKNLASAPHVRVAVYALAVTTEASVWPEMRERDRQWTSVSDAMTLIANGGMRQALTAFADAYANTEETAPPSK